MSPVPSISILSFQAFCSLPHTALGLARRILFLAHASIFEAPFGATHWPTLWTSLSACHSHFLPLDWCSALKPGWPTAVWLLPTRPREHDLRPSKHCPTASSSLHRFSSNHGFHPITNFNKPDHQQNLSKTQGSMHASDLWKRQASDDPGRHIQTALHHGSSARAVGSHQRGGRFDSWKSGVEVKALSQRSSYSSSARTASQRFPQDGWTEQSVPTATRISRFIN